MTRLDDGRISVAGGDKVNVYDPRSNTMTTLEEPSMGTRSFISSRQFHLFASADLTEPFERESGVVRTPANPDLTLILPPGQPLSAAARLDGIGAPVSRDPRLHGGAP